MRDAAGMERDAADLDPAPGHEVAADVVHDLFAVDVRVVVRRRDRKRVVIELARHERADDEVRSLEGLVHRRWLVDPPGDRFEIADIERPG